MTLRQDTHEKHDLHSNLIFSLPNFVKRAIKPLGKILRIQKKQITKIRGWDKTFYEHHIGLNPLISDILPLGLLGEIKPL